MKEISEANVYKIVFSKYGSKWTGYYIADNKLDPLANAEMMDEFDEVWGDEEACDALVKELGYVWVSSIDDEPTDFTCLIKDDDILYEAWPNDVLSGGWGYHEPAAGAGLNSCNEPEYFFIDGDSQKRYLK